MFTNRLYNLIVLLLLITITGIGFAGFPRSEASGNFITTSTTIHSAMEDKFNEIIDLSSTINYTGTLEGTSTLEGTLVVHHDGSATFKGVEKFTGLVNGRPGTLTFKLTGGNDVYQMIQLTNSIISGTGDLTSLQGVLSKTGIVRDDGPAGAYTGRINQASNPTLEKEESNEY